MSNYHICKRQILTSEVDHALKGLNDVPKISKYKTYKKERLLMGRGTLLRASTVCQFEEVFLSYHLILSP